MMKIWLKLGIEVWHFQLESKDRPPSHRLPATKEHPPTKRYRENLGRTLPRNYDLFWTLPTHMLGHMRQYYRKQKLLTSGATLAEYLNFPFVSNHLQVPFQNIWPSVTCLDIIFRQLSKNVNKASFSLVLFGSLTKGINPSCFTNKPWIIPAIRSASGFGFSGTWKRHGSQPIVPIVQSTENTPYQIKNHFTRSWLDELRHPKSISKTTY